MRPSNLVFLDVGANTGQTLEAAMLFQFDRIFCFEPVKKFHEQLLKVPTDHFSGRITYCNYGLLDRDDRINVYGAVDGSDGWAASISPDHADVKPAPEELCFFRKTSDWLRQNLVWGDIVVMKLNCEGSEIEILSDLFDTRLYPFIFNLMVDFDAVKIPSKIDQISALLGKLEVTRNYRLAEDVMIGATHQDRICHWLDQLQIPRL